MKNNIILKELYEQKKYDELINCIDEEFEKLFKKMLDNKRDIVKEDYSKKNFDSLSLIVCKYYPRYKQDIVNLNHLIYERTNTVNDVLNSMLSIYEYLSDTYLDEDEEDI